MVFTQILVVLYAFIDVVGLPGNLLVITTVFMKSEFHIMRYILLASLATSDVLFLVLGNSLNIASAAQERWLYSKTVCEIHRFLTRYFYLNTVAHLIAVSYDRYSAIVKSPLTYNGSVTRSRVVVIVLVWTMPVFLIAPPIFQDGATSLFYNPEVLICIEVVKQRVLLVPAIFLLFVAPFMMIVYLNWRVFQTANTLQINTVAAVQPGSLAGSTDLNQQEQFETRRMIDRKAAVDVCIIIAAFLLCYLPIWTVSTLHLIFKEEFPFKVIQITRFIFYASTLTNPIIYSIRKREFRAGVKSMLKRIAGLCGIQFAPNNVITNLTP